MKKQRYAGTKALVAERKNSLMKQLFEAVNNLEEADFTDGFIALSQNGETVAELACRLFTRRILNVHIVDTDTVDRFNQIASRYATRHGVMSVLVDYDLKNSEWKSVDILMADEKVFDSACYIEEFDKVIPVADHNCTTEEIFEQTRRNYSMA